MEFRLHATDLCCVGETRKIGGYINVTERESEILYNKNKGKWFKETMKRGVFERALTKAQEIPLLLQHDWNKQLASTSNNSLCLREDQIGLRFEAEIEDELLYAQVRDKKINSCSFGFSVVKEVVEPINSKLEKRNVEEINLYEVSLVENPAYEGSLVEIRSYEAALKADEDSSISDELTVTNTVDTEERESEVKEEKSKSKKDEESETSSEESKDESKEDKTSKDSEDSKEVKENSDKEKKPEDEKSKDSESEEEEREGSLTIAPGMDVITTSEFDKTQLKNLVDELIDSKLAEIDKAKIEEEFAHEDLEIVKQINADIESDCEQFQIQKMNELIKLQIELLKLKDIKRGIQ